MNQRTIHAPLQRLLAHCSSPPAGDIYFLLPCHSHPSASWSPAFSLLREAFSALERYTPALELGAVDVADDGLIRACIQRFAGSVQDPEVDGYKHREVYLHQALRAITQALGTHRATVILPPTHPDIDTYNEVTRRWMYDLDADPDVALQAVVALDMDAIAEQLDAQATNNGANRVIVQACGMGDADRRTYPSSEYLDAHFGGSLGVMLTGAENGTVLRSGYIMCDLDGAAPLATQPPALLASAVTSGSLRLWRWGLSSRPTLRTAYDALLRLGNALREADVVQVVLPKDVVRMLTRTPEMHNAYASWIEMLLRNAIRVCEIDLGERPSVQYRERPAITYMRITDFFAKHADGDDSVNNPIELD